ncbi:carboxylesterase [Pseudoxanthomonas sp. Root65]|uniref:carboxylesterase/lipase family protein n=1 Tax=Pseudoxanthomonas sp. Root65 TaxID=1736576 RepID=UPI0006F1F1AE|nr:carboxylesterase/lipase family protein [Pseudoxanthomonas sp. Root65]KRA52683.1 carboxylesterase [Pseudoxanthomonas sp. Root65]
MTSSLDTASRRRFLAQLAGTSGLALASACLPAGADTVQATSATTRSGRIAGRVDRGIHVFRGLPYGADTATRRFQRAVRETPWTGVRDATRFGASAPQRGDADGQPVSEDCLFLNVCTPALRDGGRRPILFYIHGGGYNNGSGSHPLYDGANLCRRGDVVVVTVNHRLNAFGYLHLGESGDERVMDAGNIGQLDLIDALHWVREHAHEFGGDAGNVTVFGQSGGGAKIATLMAMPAADGLFHKAMTMSGQQVTAAGPRAAAQRSALFLGELGLRPGDIDALLAMPMARLLDATRLRDPSRAEDTSLYFGPVLDARNLHRHPFYPDAPAQSARIPMIIGNTRDETRAFLGNDEANFSLTWEQVPQKLREQQYVDLSPEVVIAEYRRLYPDYTPSEVFFAATTAGRSWRGAVIEAEERAKQGAPAWVYQVDWRSPAENGRLRAFHTLDIPLVFDNIGAEGSKTGADARARTMAARMSAALIALARHGDPNHAGLPAWAPYTLPQRQTMVFDDESRMQDDPRGGERRLYERVPFIQRGTM